jgi:hypothetical protein
MEMLDCHNCGKRTGHKRTLGFGTFFAVFLTFGLWILAIPFYPKRCIICGERRSVNSWNSLTPKEMEVINKKTPKKILISMLLILIAIIVLASLDAFFGEIRQGTKAPAESTTDSEYIPDITVDSQRLISDYKANEIAADNVYKDKTLQITGIVKSITKDYRDMPHIQISGYFQSYSDIDCSFRKNVEASLSNLRIGQSVTIIGRCTGMFLGVVILEHCHVGPNG